MPGISGIRSMNRILFLAINSSLFAAAMGWLEGVVVVYLRTILLRRPDWKMIEITREAATLIMITVFALAAGRSRRERIGTFLWVFGVWDIIYYASLWTWLNWPASLTTMDTLFYIPCVWQAPVYVPVLFSLIMMLTGFLLWRDRWTAHLAAGWKWGIRGWLAGFLIGLANALIRGLPLSVSAMGMSFCLGLTAAGIGFAHQFGGNTDGKFTIRTLAAMTIGGVIGGILGHLARSMFYASPYSFLWPAGLGLISGVILFLAGKHGKTHSPVPGNAV